MNRRSPMAFGIATAILIVSALAAAPIDTPADDESLDSGLKAFEVFECAFEDASDRNYDAWPDEWQRRNGVGYPAYVKMEIVESPDDPMGNRCFRVQLDGGSAAASSPPIEVDSRFSFHFEGRIRTEQLQRDQAFLSLTFCDEDMKPLETLESQRISGTTAWTKVRMGPLSPRDSRTRWAIVNVHVAAGAREDLKGAVYFDDLRMDRLPRIMLQAGGLRHLYMTGETVQIDAIVSGVSHAEQKLLFELFDADGKKVQESIQSIDMTTADRAVGSGRLAGKARWMPAVPGPGFYRARVSMTGDDDSRLEHSINLAVIEPEKPPVGGEFGWTLPEGEKPFGFGPLATLISHSGVNWVKFPTWYGDDEETRSDRIARFAEKLSINHIEMIGMLDRPPADQQKNFVAGSEAIEAASMFTDPNVWQPLIDPVMTRLSLKVHWWQLGSDDDLSYLGHPDVPGKIREVKNYLERYGQTVRIGIPWRSITKPPAAAAPPWDFLTFTDDPALTADEIASQGVGVERKDVERWLTMRPLPKGEYTDAQRRCDLVKRMIAAKMRGVDSSFVPRPFDDREGLFRADGTPGELFLPWRTTSLAVSGKEYLGSLALPNGSENHVFALGEEAMLVAWNDRPVTEKAFLGEEIRRVDLWGRSAHVAKTDDEGVLQQAIDVGPDPVFFYGVNPYVARWCMKFAFTGNELESLFGRDQKVSYTIRNDFPKGVGGQVSFHAPHLWDTPPRPLRFRLAQGEERIETFPLRLKPDADHGPQTIRVDFDITADKVYHFSVFRTLNVGLSDIEVELDTRMTERGELAVDAHLTNRTGKLVSFQCSFFPPGRRREQRQVINLGAERTTVSVVVPKGEELIGKEIWMKLEELGGSRVMNHHTTAQK